MYVCSAECVAFEPRGYLYIARATSLVGEVSMLTHLHFSGTGDFRTGLCIVAR